MSVKTTMGAVTIRAQTQSAALSAPVMLDTHSMKMGLLAKVYHWLNKRI